MKRLVGRQIGHLDPQQIFKGPRDVVALHHFRAKRHGALEGALRFLGMLRQPHGHIDDIGSSGLNRVEPGGIARNHPAPLELLNPAQASRWRQTHPFRQINVADPPIRAKLAQYPAADIVNSVHKLQDITQQCIKRNNMRCDTAQIAPMNMELLYALTLFAFVSSITPGPNNLMLMTSGTNFGLRRTLPHMLGVGLGFMVMVALVGLGLITLFEQVPYSATALKTISTTYLLWLAWKMARFTPAPDSAITSSRPMTLLQAAAFQWVNPKAWMMAIAAISAYAPDRSIQAVTAVALVFGAVNLPCVGSWALLGTRFRRFLSSPTRLSIFNHLMAALLLATLIPFLRTDLPF